MTKNIPLLKSLPIAHRYDALGAHFVEMAGWQIPKLIDGTEEEYHAATQLCALSDWSDIAKFNVRGTDAADVTEKLASTLGLDTIPHTPLRSGATRDCAVLCLTPDEYCLLAQPAMRDQIRQAVSTLNDPNMSITDQTGANACFVLLGPKRDAILERSTAMNLRRDLITPGTVIQTSVHGINTCLFRTTHYEVIVHARGYADSLYQALMDVGHHLGLKAVGRQSVAIDFTV